MLATVAKIALLAFLALAVLAIIVVFIRNSREKSFPSWVSSSQFDQMRGAMPPMPRPDGFDDDAEDVPPQRI